MNVTHLRVWATAADPPGHLAVVTKLGDPTMAPMTARRIRAALARKYKASLVLLEHYPATRSTSSDQTLDLIFGVDGNPGWSRVWPTPEGNPRHAGLELWMARNGYQIVRRPASYFDRREDEGG